MFLNHLHENHFLVGVLIACDLGDARDFVVEEIITTNLASRVHIAFLIERGDLVCSLQCFLYGHWGREFFCLGSVFADIQAQNILAFSFCLVTVCGLAAANRVLFW